MYDDLLGKRKVEKEIPEKKHYNLVKDELPEEELNEVWKNWTEGDPGYLEPSQDIAQLDVCKICKDHHVDFECDKCEVNYET